MKTGLALQLAVRNTSLAPTDKGTAFFLETDLHRLVADIRGFIRAFQKRNGPPDGDKTTQSRIFAPLDLPFSFALLDSDVGPDLDDEITIRIMLLQTASAGLSSAKSASA